MSARKKSSENEIKRRLIADADKPHAWESAIKVRPSSSPRPAWYGRRGETSQVRDGVPRSQAIPRNVAYNTIRAQKSASRTAHVVNIEDARLRRQRQLTVREKLDTEHKEEALHMKRLHDAIAELPEGQRQCLQLWLDGFKYIEIAKALSISSDAVKSRLRDAKSGLRDRLERAYHQQILTDRRAGGVKH